MQEVYNEGNDSSEEEAPTRKGQHAIKDEWLPPAKNPNATSTYDKVKRI